MPRCGYRGRVTWDRNDACRLVHRCRTYKRNDPAAVKRGGGALGHEGVLRSSLRSQIDVVDAVAARPFNLDFQQIVPVQVNIGARVGGGGHGLNAHRA